MATYGENIRNASIEPNGKGRWAIYTPDREIIGEFDAEVEAHDWLAVEISMHEPEDERGQRWHRT